MAPPAGTSRVSPFLNPLLSCRRCVSRDVTFPEQQAAQVTFSQVATVGFYRSVLTPNMNELGRGNLTVAYVSAKT